MIKAIIADDQRLLRESFKHIIENNSDIIVVATAVNGKEAFELCGIHKPDVVIMDVTMPELNGIDATKMIKSKYPSIKILMLTASDDEADVAEAIAVGANGYILKDVGTEELILSIKSIVLGLEIMQKGVFKSALKSKNDQKRRKNKTIAVAGIDVTLTERELKVIQLLVDGKDNKEIGGALFIAEGTAKNLITEIISKLQLKDRTQLAVFAIKNNLII